MSVTTTIPAAAAAPLGFGKSSLRCPNCGVSIPHDSSHRHDGDEDYDDIIAAAQRQRVEELEAQVRHLSTKAALAENKLTEYQEELRRVKIRPSAEEEAAATRASSSIPSSNSHGNSSGSTSTDSTSLTSSNGVTAAKPLPFLPSNPPKPQPPAKHGRLPSFFSGRSTPSDNSKHSATASDTSELQAALAREQALRQKAEKMLADTNSELEELSTQLFQQANEMVATERKARAKLEERVAVLERRDEDKRRRLELLEGAVNRIERVRGLLAGS